MLKLRSSDRMQLNQICDLAHLPVPPVVIYDIWCIFIFYDHYHEQPLSYKFTHIESTIIYMHAE